MTLRIAQFRCNVQVKHPPVKMETDKANHLARLIRPIVKKVLGLVFIAAIEDAMAKVAFMPVVTVTGLFGPLHQCDLSAPQIIRLLIGNGLTHQRSPFIAIEKRLWFAYPS